MRAARFRAEGLQLVVEDVPDPAPGPNDVLLRVEACGICLSDVHLVVGMLPPLLPEVTPGHETVGIVEEVGAEVRGWAPGDRAVLMGGRPCLTCDRCRAGRIDECLLPQVMGFAYDGGWAERVVVPFYALTPAPPDLPAAEVAILADAVATPYAALTDRGGLRAGESVGLWGIGGLGTHAVQLARLLGAASIVAVDPLPAARARALAVGADVAVDPAEDLHGSIDRATGGRGLDLAIDFVGVQATLKQALGSLARRGRAVIVGMHLETLELGTGAIFNFKETSLFGHLGYGKRHLDELVALLAAGRLDLTASISDEIALDDVADGVRRLREKDGDPVRIVVRP